MEIMLEKHLLPAMAALCLLVSDSNAQEPAPPTKTVTEPVQEAASPAPVLSEEAKPELERPTIWGEPTEVEMTLYMIDLDEVNSAEQNFAASVYYEARWQNTFLMHEGPGPIHRGITEVWTPRLVIVNQQMAWPAFPGSVEIYPDGAVVHRQKVWGRFSQPLELPDFPLDQQTLTIHIAAAGLLQEEVKLVPSESDEGGIASQFSVPNFEVVSWKVEPAPYPSSEDAGAVPGFKMELVVQRRFGFFVTKIIVPLCLIVMMSWAPRWIDPEQIGTNIGVSTTAFLTLVAYLFATTALLPPVSYITRMDRFIFLSMLVVFAGLVQTIASTMLVHNGRTATAQRIDRWSRFANPAILLVVLVLAFVV
jgi:hypothetical protein